MENFQNGSLVKIFIDGKNDVVGRIDEISERNLVVSIQDNHPLNLEFLEINKEYTSYISTHKGNATVHSQVVNIALNERQITIRCIKTYDIINRRQFVRVPGDFKLLVMAPELCESFYCINISCGGAAVKDSRGLLKKDSVICVALPSENFKKDVICKAIVVRNENSTSSIRFLDLDSDSLSLITEFVFNYLSDKSS